MFDIGATELLLIAVVAILIIGPKDMPTAFRTAGRWIGKVRRMSGQFRAGLDNIVREAEMEEMDAKWKAHNAKIMRDHPDGVPTAADAAAGPTAPGDYGAPGAAGEMVPEDMMPPEKAAAHRRIVAEKELAMAQEEELAIIREKEAAAAAGARAEARSARDASPGDAQTTDEPDLFGSSPRPARKDG